MSPRPLDPSGYWPAVRLGGWPIPAEVRTLGDGFIWKLADPDGTPVSESPPVDDFVRLRTGEPEQIAAFALRWGVLDLCAHGIPRHHHAEDGSRLGLAPSAPCSPLPAPGRRNSQWRYEPFAAWRVLADQAGTLRQLGQDLNRGNTGAATAWESLPLYGLGWTRKDPKQRGPVRLGDGGVPVRDWIPRPGLVPHNPKLTKRQSIELAREWYSIQINEWLSWADLSVQLSWGRTAEVRIHPTSAFGAIALALARGATRSDIFTSCSACGQPYTPSRKPDPKKRNYCPDCRDAGVPQREAMRAKRQRDAEESA